MIGKLLDGRYRIKVELAEGGFSQTYLAEDTRLPKNPKCVVKHLNPTIDDPIFTKKALELFTAEAETLQELGKHDRIPQLYAYFQENKEFYLVQEYIAGHPLSTEMHPGSRMAEARVAQIVKEILEILRFVHKYNVIHRDIKPSNIIRRHSDGKLVLIDFGTVKQVQMEVANAHNKARVTLPIGTPGYMSYEQERGQSVASSDIYSLGMVALQALTGKHPSQFTRDRDNEIIWRDHVGRQMGREFAAILDRMTRCHLRDRYQTIDEVIKDLAKLPKLSTESPKIIDDRQPQKTQRPLILLLPMLIAIFAAIGIYQSIHQTSDRPLSSKPSAPQSIPTPQPSNSPISSDQDPINFDQLRNQLKAQDWESADQTTHLILLRAAGSQSFKDGTFHPDELNRISCAEIVLIDQLWTQATDGKQGLTAQKKIYESTSKDLRKTYEIIGWLKPSGEFAVNTLYNRQTSRWEYLEGRQPSFKASPTGHLPFLFRELSAKVLDSYSAKNLDRLVNLYRCS
jgi:serine/threonine protein kinase